MRALPPQIEPSDNSITGIGCPDCPGCLQVRTEGDRGYLRFECRIGHVYSLESLLESKERAAEQRLWAAVLVYVELADLLRDLEAHAVRFDGAITPLYRARSLQATALADTLRNAAEQDRPLRWTGLDPPEPLTEGDGST